MFSMSLFLQKKKKTRITLIRLRKDVISVMNIRSYNFEWYRHCFNIVCLLIYLISHYFCYV